MNKHQKTASSRRDFIKLGMTASAGALFLPATFPSLLSSAFGSSALANPARKTNFKIDAGPHFFLMITLPNASGLDSSYLWDARPLAMTQAGIIQNYRTPITEPTPWVGTNGVSTLATELVQPLLPFQSNFTVINGATMDIGFDGHDQNINYLFTGDPFGGECFIPHLNSAPLTHKELDAIQRGRFTAASTNGNETVPLNPSAAKNLITSLGTVPPLDPSSKLFQFLSSRFQANSNGGGGFSAASASMQAALSSSASLAQMMGQVKTDGVDSDVGFVQLAAQIFSAGAAKSAVLVIDPAQNIFDTHDPDSASKQPTTYQFLINSLVNILTTMKNTPYDATRSMLDVTTFMFAAEFGRTLRQYGKPITATGTDHNPLANCVLIGGKGIRGGQVIGSTDYASATETLSAAHLSLDSGKEKVMGRPFDFTNGISRTDLPATYLASDYLGFNSIVNTIYSQFKVDQSHWRLTERNGIVAPILLSLLS
jgi:hypothetical protein